MAWVRPTQAEVWQAAWLFAPLLFVLFVGLRHASGLVTRLLSSRVATLLGRVSYSLYLTHIIAFTLASRWFTGHDDALTGGLAAAALAAVYFLAVERPFVRLSRRIVVSAGEGESRAPVAAGGDTTAATVPTAAK
jgi:peptidoglycan/LPS O-acetylase OafA/YrhL